MALGRKTGGRQLGTPNRRTREASDMLAAVGLDPLEAMATLALAPDTPLELRVRLLAELAGYVYPKRKAVDVNANVTGGAVFALPLPAETSSEEWAAKVRAAT